MISDYTKWILKVIDHSLTGIDGETYDPARICMALGINVFMFLSVYNTVFLGNAFVAQDFGIGFGAILAAGGAAIGLKSKTEPSGND
jgi:hypothetical protein